MRDMTEAELEAVYERRECPFCGEKSFWPGPRGGASQNITFSCGAKLNVIDPELWDTYPLKWGQVIEEPLRERRCPICGGTDCHRPNCGER